MAGVGGLFAGLDRSPMALITTFKYSTPTVSGQCTVSRRRVNIEEPQNLKKKQTKSAPTKRKDTCVTSTTNKKQKLSVENKKKKRKVFTKKFTPDIFQ